MKCRIITYCTILTAIFLAGDLAAANVKNINIGPLNRAVVFFDTLPGNYKSYLKADKTLIEIKFEGKQDKLFTYNSDGIINSAGLSSYGDSVAINITLDVPRGYNAVALPFTRSLMIEVFRWESLDKHEDIYRTAMLAYEDGMIGLAYKGFAESAGMGNADAAFFTGLFFLRSGNMALAEKYLKYADYNGSGIPDLYAALTQIASLKGDSAAEAKYLKLFTERTGLDGFDFISEDSLYMVNVNSLENTINIDSLLALSAPATKDSTDGNVSWKSTGDTSKIFIEKKQAEAIFPWWMEYLAYGFFALALILVYLYFKWRNEKLKQLKKQKARKFEQELEEQEPKPQKSTMPTKQASAPAGKAIGAYSDKEVEKEKPAPEKDFSKAKSNTSKFLKSVKPETQSDIKGKVDDFKKELLDKQKELNNPSAREEMLNSLSERQKEKKSSVYGKIDSKIIRDPDKIADKAKELGVEKAGIEIKGSLDELSKDEEKLKKLSDKFNK